MLEVCFTILLVFGLLPLSILCELVVVVVMVVAIVVAVGAVVVK